MTETERLVGVWGGSAHPLQETTVVLCADGRGLLFYYQGSTDGSPFVDEFAWRVLDGGGRMQVTWHLLHVYEEDVEGEGQEEDEEEPTAEYEPRVTVTSGKVEVVPYRRTEGVEPALYIDLGLHDWSYDPVPLRYVGAAGPFERERERLQSLAEGGFDPFGPDRQVWVIGDENEWRKVAVPVDEAEDEADAGGWRRRRRQRRRRTRAARVQGCLSHFRGLPYLYGVLGQMAYLADCWPPSVLIPLRIALHGVPSLAYLIEDGEPGRWARVVRRVGGTWFLAVTAGVLAAAVAGYRPRGWWFYLLLIACGLPPYVRAALPSRGEARKNNAEES